MPDKTQGTQSPIQHHPLCGKEIIPAEQPRLTALQAAYSQGVEDAMCAIRAESQGGGYWAATFINAIARKCNPHVYVNRIAAFPVDQSKTEFEQLSREQIIQAITDIEDARESHVEWAAHLRVAHTFECQGCTDHAAHIGTAEYHDEWIAKYDNVIAVLARVPVTAPASPAALRDEAKLELALCLLDKFVLRTQHELRDDAPEYLNHPAWKNLFDEANALLQGRPEALATTPPSTLDAPPTFRNTKTVVPVTASPSTLAQAAAEEICRYFGDTELAMNGPVNVNGVAAIIERCLAGGGEE